MREIQNYEHDGKRKNIPEVGLVSSVTDKVENSKKYEFDPYLNPELNWSGKKEENYLEIDTVSLHVHERIDPKSLIEKLKKISQKNLNNYDQLRLNFFDNPGFEAPLLKALQFYEHDQDWSNRLIAGDSLLVMNSLLEKEGMEGKIQTIFMDPPYGINFRSNFQPFTNRSDHKDGNDESIPHEPEMIKAFRDTWELGIHSYLTHIRSRVLLSKQLLSDSGSMFLQISDKNLNYCIQIMEEIFGKENFFGIIAFTKAPGNFPSNKEISSRIDYLVWFAKNKSKMKYNPLFVKRKNDIDAGFSKIMLPDGTIRPLTSDEKNGKKNIPEGRLFRDQNSLIKRGPGAKYEVELNGEIFDSGNGWWGYPKETLEKLIKLGRVKKMGNTLRYLKFLDDFPYKPLDSLWDDLGAAKDKVYVVQTNEEVIKRCILMTSSSGDIVFDPTCGAGTTAIAAERLGRKWITCDTSRVALNLSRKRLMTEVYDFYKLKIPEEGLSGGLQYKEVEKIEPNQIAKGNIGKKETIYLEPIKDNLIKRVSGPFTIEAVPSVRVRKYTSSNEIDLNHDIENYINEIRSTGIRTIQGEKIKFINVERSKGYKFIHATGQIIEDGSNKKVFICFGPNYAPLEQTQIEQAIFEVRENVNIQSILVFCAFQFDPEGSKDIDQFQSEKITILKSQMSVDLLTNDLRKKRSSNQSFWLIGQPDIEINKDHDQYYVKIKGFDYYNPLKGSVESKGVDGIALWMIDTDYDDRSLCPDQFFFPINDQNDWNKLRKSLRNEIDEDKVIFFQGSQSEPFKLGINKKIAVKIVDNRGIESLVVRDLT